MHTPTRVNTYTLMDISLYSPTNKQTYTTHRVFNKHLKVSDLQTYTVNVVTLQRVSKQWVRGTRCSHQWVTITLCYWLINYV